MNLEFLKKLKQKLQVGNTRSIHLNLYPGRFATRLDLSELEHIEKALSQKFLDKLLSQPSFSLKFKIKNLNPEGNTSEKEEFASLNRVSKRLTSIYYESEDIFLEHGVKTFGFGFPTLVYRTKADPAKIINAPVFIWKLDILREKNEWLIQKDEEFGITINDVLLNYLEQDLGSSGFFSLNDEYLTDSLLDKEELLKIINRLLKQISSGSQEINDFPEISPVPDKSGRTSMLGSSASPLISFSGAFGLFRAQKEAIINDIKTLIQNPGEYEPGTSPEETETYQAVKYSAVETDPTQTRALNSIGQSDRLIIHGPPGTGKSQTLTAIIVNALFNRAKCLVVCEKRTALEVLQKNLTMLGLGGLCALIEDVNRDRKKIVDAVRDPQPAVNPVNKNILDEIFAESDRYIDKINVNHRFYGRYILNDNTWSDLVGKFLSLKESESRYEELYSKIKNAGIDFTSGKISEDYNKRKPSVKRNFRLYTPAKDIAAIFKILNDRLFENNRSSKEIVVELSGEIKKYIERLNGVIRKSEQLHSDYSNALTIYYKEYYEQFSTALQKITGNYEKNTAVNRYLFTKLKGFPDVILALFSILSKKYRNLKSDKKNIVSDFYNLEQFTSKNYFESSILPVKESITELYEQTEAVGKSLNEWYGGIGAFIEKELSEYHAGNCNKFAGENMSFEEIEGEFNNITRELNDSGLFSVRFSFDTDSNHSKTTCLKQVNKSFEALVNDIDCLYDYTHWRKDYTAGDSHATMIIDSLIEIGSVNWELDFELWYLFNLLIANEDVISLRDDSLYISLSENTAKIRQYQADIIKDYWRQKQAESAAALESRTGINVNALYNKSRNSRFQKRNSLRRIITADFRLFTDFFPVMLVNPGVCSSLLDMKPGMFDVVIFDEASQLRIEDVYAAKLRGKNKVVAGDENQMPPSSYFAAAPLFIDSEGQLNEEDEDIIAKAAEGLADSESLLEFSIRSGYTETSLDIHYRSRHPDLINFSNAAFYGSRLNPVPPERNYRAIRYFQTYGIYDPAEGVNFVEASKVISLIDDLIKPGQGEDNPSIGIATFNIFQRNFILDLIQQKSETDALFAEKMGILRNKPGETFFVKNLENIQGDERDIIIISTTFGKKADGSFLQNFGPINQEKGFRLLNVIVTRAKHMMIVCTSIPEEIIGEYTSLLPAAGNRGKAVFYTYLAYARSVEKSEHSEKAAILEMLSSNRESYGNISARCLQTAFEQEVIKALAFHIAPERIIPQYELGGFVIDIAVLPGDPLKNITAIECDGTNFHNSPEAYVWDMFRKSYLERRGIKFIRTWSVNWWNNPRRELNKLLEIINNS